ncbi:unnamed protein product [Nesidiocoris tenuis]|uniref:Uncharacterized protein n=1 Tax=Nesidiocoris tenuis TaxID=355587 RepID=A0A6H5HMF1_9HEMI|nr:unnamed protein product [Nesidiocoris tenuis]
MATPSPPSCRAAVSAANGPTCDTALTAAPSYLPAGLSCRNVRHSANQRRDRYGHAQRRLKPPRRFNLRNFQTGRFQHVGPYFADTAPEPQPMPPS